jgi:hypothetical protein
MAIIGLLGIDIVKVMLALGKHVWNCCWACNAMYHYKILKKTKTRKRTYAFCIILLYSKYSHSSLF